MDDRVRSGRLGRTLRPVKLGAETTAAAAVRKLRSLGAGDERKERQLNEFHERMAARYAAELGNMKGAAMKLGQLLSFIDIEMIPEKYREIYRRSLGTLLADAPPTDPDLLEHVIEMELGAPASDVFAVFEREPIASASIGQVHRARLDDGTDVAVKVQYPGVAEAIENDLRNGELLATMFRLGQSVMGGIAPKTDPRVIIEELRERVTEELDYEIEASNQRFFAALYEGHPFIAIPRVIDEYSTTRVLTTQYIDGERWASALDAPPDLKRTWAEAIFRFSLGSLDRFGVFNADPHPGNYLFHDDGTVTFLDFGCVKVMHDGRHLRLVETIRAAAEGRADDLRALLIELGFLPEHDDLAAAELLDWFVGGQPHFTQRPYEFTHADISNYIRRTYDPLGPHADIVKRFTMPKDNVILSRIDLGLWSILACLGGAVDWRGISDEIWSVGPPTGELGDAEARWLASMRARSDWPPPIPTRSPTAAVGT